MTNNGKEEPVCNDKIYSKVGMKNIMRYIYTTKNLPFLGNEINISPILLWIFFNTT